MADPMTFAEATDEIVTGILALLFLPVLWLGLSAWRWFTTRIEGGLW